MAHIPNALRYCALRLQALGGRAALALCVLLAVSEAEARSVRGASIPNQVSPVVGDQTGLRFVVNRPMIKALRELQRTYGRTTGVMITRLRSPRRVKAYLIENTRPRRTWDAIALYQREKGPVFLTVIPAEPRKS